MRIGREDDGLGWRKDFRLGEDVNRFPSQGDQHFRRNFCDDAIRPFDTSMDTRTRCDEELLTPFSDLGLRLWRKRVI